jgi:hypothetical protein
VITYLGEVSLSDVAPMLADALALLSSAKAFAIPQLQAQLAGVANLLASITIAPPQLGATITAALAVVAQLQASISGPTVTLQASALLSLMAQLQLDLAALSVSISVPSATVSAFVYDGPSAQMGTEVQGAINANLPGAGPGDHTRALVLATTDAPAWAAVGLVLKTS